MLSLSPSSIAAIILALLLSISGGFNYYHIGKVASLSSKVKELGNTTKEAVASKEKVSESCKQDDKAIRDLVEGNNSTDVNTKSLQEQLKDLSKAVKPISPYAPTIPTKSDEKLNEIPINSKLPADLNRVLDKAYQDNR
jgi:uncharacterized protein HemX